MAMWRGMGHSVASQTAYGPRARAQGLGAIRQQNARTRRPSGRGSAVSLLQAALEYVPGCTRETTMKTERPDPNAELAGREPLRIVFALAALLLGLIAAMH